jgi:hypothetical protein
VKGKILNAKKRRRLMVHLKLEIWFSCVFCIHIRNEWIIGSNYWGGKGTWRNQ